MFGAPSKEEIAYLEALIAWQTAALQAIATKVGVTLPAPPTAPQS
jgi:hypothetical protein